MHEPSYTTLIDCHNKGEGYRLLTAQAKALVEGETDEIANGANLSALVYGALPDLNWAGFYRSIGDELVLGPFQGKPACVRIAMGRGVCGTAAAKRQTIVVPDVHAFTGHIACDSASRSEIVIPVVIGDALWGVFDLDSPLPGRFDALDQQGLKAVVEVFIRSFHV